MRANLEWTVCEEGEEPEMIAGPAQPPDYGRHGLRARAARAAARAAVKVAMFAAAIVVPAAAGGMLWMAAEEGARQLQADVTAAARLQTLQRNAADPNRHEHTAVTGVEVLEGQALAHLVVTQTLPDGEEVVQRVTRAYAQTPHGWMPLAAAELPPAAWGAAQTIDTAHLHFVLHSRDRATVEALAPHAEALYTALETATGETLDGPDGRLTIRVVPGKPGRHERPAAGEIWLPSPLLLPACPQEAAYLPLANLLRPALADALLDKAAAGAGAQWRPVVEGVRLYLAQSGDLPLAPNTEDTPFWTRGGADPTLHLPGLLAEKGGPWSTGSLPPWEHYNEARLASTALKLAAFLAARHGPDVLGELVAGCGRYDDWETLAPAVLGTTAPALDAAWHAAWRADE